MRLGYLDFLRAMAVIWMIIFHTTYDLSLLGFIKINFNQGFWYGFPRVIAWTFLFCVGISLNLVHVPNIKWSSLTKRSLKLGLAALAISVSTYIIFPHQWIYFGTIHCILVGSFLGALVVNHRRLALILFLSILILQYGLDYDIEWISKLTKRRSMDFIPIYPWFWAILAGILLGPIFSKIKLLQNLPVPHTFSFLGRHSLKIYLLHQPIIFGTLWGIKFLLST